MRDEIKAALVCCILVSILILLLVFRYPVNWKLNSMPLAPATRHLEREPLLPPAQFDQFVKVYGPPTAEEQSPHGSLSPPLFTKWLDYEPEHLRIAFVAVETRESAAGKNWIAISFIDATKTVPLSAEEAGRRLMSRHKQVP